MSEDGKKRLRDLANQVRQKVTPNGATLLNQRGLDLVDDLARELTGEGGMPGLRVERDGPTKIRLTRQTRNAEITLAWERDIGALGVTCEKHGEPRTFVRYVWDDAQAKWRKLDGGGEIYEDVTSALVTYLYPEAAPPVP
ncbi:MAG: hypothetical protein JWP97_6771 [Labilithrix sp.]|nr:hypothetical protein [Labilithrix sp.]